MATIPSGQCRSVVVTTGACSIWSCDVEEAQAAFSLATLTSGTSLWLDTTSQGMHRP